MFYLAACNLGWLRDVLLECVWEGRGGWYPWAGVHPYALWGGKVKVNRVLFVGESRDFKHGHTQFSGGYSLGLRGLFEVCKTMPGNPRPNHNLKWSVA